MSFAMTTSLPFKLDFISIFPSLLRSAEFPAFPLFWFNSVQLFTDTDSQTILKRKGRILSVSEILQAVKIHLPELVQNWWASWPVEFLWVITSDNVALHKCCKLWAYTTFRPISPTQAANCLLTAMRTLPAPHSFWRSFRSIGQRDAGKQGLSRSKIYLNRDGDKNDLVPALQVQKPVYENFPLPVSPHSSHL